VGTKSAALSVTTNAAGSPHTVALAGIGVNPGVTLSPAALTFNPQAIGAPSATQSVTLTNSGGATLTITSITLGGANAGEFSQTNNCGTSLSAGANCTIQVTLTPTSSGTKTAVVIIVSNAPSSPNSVALSGSGAGPGAALSVTSLDFPNQAINVTSAPQSVTLTNSGSADLIISAIGVNNGSVFAQTNNCPGTLAPAAFCTFNVTFKPLGALNYIGSVSITDNSGGSPHVVNLSGSGVATPGVSLTPTSLGFNAQVIGTVSAAQSVTLTNTGGGTLTIASIALAGVNAGEFSQTNNCGTSLAAGANCTISVTFTPASAGAKGAQVSVVTNATSNPDWVVLSGTGVTAASVSLAPTSVVFSPQLVNSSSAGQSVTLSNPGGATLTITSITLGGANAGDFVRSDNCGTGISGGGSCVITVTFRPTGTGSRTATVSVNSNASGSPHSIPLAGEGTDFNVGAAPGSPTSATVSPGGTASFTLSLAPVNGYSGNVALSCISVSVEVSCAVPASVAMSGAAMTVTVTVTTTTRAWMPFRGGPREPWPPGGKNVALAWIALLLLTGATFHWAKARGGRMRMRAHAAMALAAVLLCAQLWSGCGGAGSTPRPARSYPITVSATASGGTRTISLTVVVP
jgi:hypothetical protein